MAIAATKRELASKNCSASAGEKRDRKRLASSGKYLFSLSDTMSVYYS